MKIWKLVAIVSAAAFSGIFAGALGARTASADGGWSCPKHGNLTIAHGDVMNARQHMTDAQNANDFDMKGHAGNAKTALETAKGEIEAACQVLQSK